MSTISEIIDHIIPLNVAIRRRESEVLRKLPGYPCIWMSDLAADRTPPAPESSELHDLLMALPPATIYMLTLIMYIGRGDIAPQDLLENYVKLSDQFQRPEWAVKQMMGKNFLREYLLDGMRELTAAGVDVDRMLSK